MKTISLKEAYDILENSSAVVIDDNALMYAGLHDLEDDDSNVFLTLSYTDDEGLIFEYNFAEGDNQEIKVLGSSMFLEDIDGEECQLTILCPQNLE